MGLVVVRANDGAFPAGGAPGSLAGVTGVLAGPPPMSPASYPNFAGKHAEEAMFTPADFAAYLRRQAPWTVTSLPPVWCCVTSGLSITMCSRPKG